MSEDRVEGALDEVEGGAKKSVGKILDDDKLQAGGQVDQTLGKLQDAYGQGKERL